MDGQEMQVKLVKKRPLVAERPMPYPPFESKGCKSTITQDTLVPNPLSRVDVHELQSALDMAQDLPQTLVQVSDLLQE
jgi:HUS1 checkpoint protein